MVFLMVFGLFSCSKWEVIEKENADSPVLLGMWDWTSCRVYENCGVPNRTITPDTEGETFQLLFGPGQFIHIYKDENYIAQHKIHYKSLKISEDIVESHRIIDFIAYLDENKEWIIDGDGTQKKLRFNYPVYTNTDCQWYITYWKKR